ncbi:TPA: hypothetical protein ACIT0T_004546, partial [Salmonella enterica subsp. enterica serovar Virchow]
MSAILKPFLLAITLMLILIRPGFATEDGAITMVKTYSAYDLTIALSFSQTASSSFKFVQTSEFFVLPSVF